TFIGTVVKASENVKISIIVAVTLVLSFLCGLMYDNIPSIVNEQFPILNRINPAALIKDSFYCLSVYDTYTRYFLNIISIFVISFVMLAVSALILRREKYASI
ncbi:MAG: hypothetical protein ACRDBM_12570, partial [Sporomusa sp.]